MSNPFQTVVVGVGHMGVHHARVYSELPESKLVAVVDVNLKLAQEIAHKYDGCAAYTRIDEVKDHIDAASVAVPTVYHREVAEPLLARGIAVLVEKPIAPDVAEAPGPPRSKPGRIACSTPTTPSSASRSARR